MTEQNRRDLLLLLNVAEKAHKPGNSPIELMEDLRSVDLASLAKLREEIEKIETQS